MTSGRKRGSSLEVFRVFLMLGLTSFGGPVAHLGYFREAFVVRLQWMSDRAYGDIVALGQLLPGPASSQVGMAIGLLRAGYGGLIAAWLAFTLPSALILIAFAFGAGELEAALGAGWIHGLKAAAVAVVAHALIGMARSLAPDRKRATIAVAGMIGAMLIPFTAGQLMVIVAGGLAGLVWLRDEPVPDGEGPMEVPVGRPTAILALLVFFFLLVALPVVSRLVGDGPWPLIDAFYRAGSMVFGGGHVVLPLLEAEVVDTGMVDRETFLAGYGAAQAVPGPLFTFAAYLGAVMETPPSALAALMALVAIFVPSALLIVGGLHFQGLLRRAPPARRAFAGVNAAVVGLLAAVFHDPILSAGLISVHATAIAAASFVALAAWKAPAWAVVLLAGVAGFVVL
ncbi:MAG: chromate efflux transporter [bacterium]|nr:chromate efflux transporter [bacterium]